MKLNPLYNGREIANLARARAKMVIPRVYFGSEAEPFGVDHIRVYNSTGEIEQHSTCKHCGGHIKRVSDEARKWAHDCGCASSRDRDHFARMRSRKATRARQAEHRKVHGGWTDYKMKKLTDSWEREDYDL